MLKSINKYTTTIFLLLAVILTFTFYIVQSIHERNLTSEHEFRYFSHHIDLQSVITLNKSKVVANIITENPNNYWTKLDSLLKDENYACFVTYYDSLCYWNTNKVKLSGVLNLSSNNNVHIANLSSGWYLYTINKVFQYKIYLLELIEPHYQLKNDILAVKSNSKYTHNPQLKLTLDKKLATHSIYNTNNQFIVGIINTNNHTNSTSSNYLIFTLFILICIFIYLYIFYRILDTTLSRTYPILGFLVIIIIIALLRYFDAILHLPHELKMSLLFTQNIYKIPLSRTSGDLMLNTILILITSIFTYRFFKFKKVTNSVIINIVGYAVFFIYTIVVIYIIYQLILDKQVFSFSDTTIHNKTLIFSVIIILILNIGMYYSLRTYLSHSKKDNYIVLPYFTIIITAVVIYYLTNIHVNIIILALLILAVVVTIKLFIWKYLTDPFINRLTIILILSALSAIIISLADEQRNDNYEKFIARTLSITNDHIFEKSYKEKAVSISTDTNLIDRTFYDTTFTDAHLQNYVIQRYFKNINKKYDIQITNCGKNDLISIQPEGEIQGCEIYFNNLIKEMTLPVNDSSLFIVNNGTESNYYIGKITLINPLNTNEKRHLFIEFISSHVPEGYGYTELLVDKQRNTLNLNDYSFAIYLRDILTYKFGDYAYNTLFQTHSYFKLNTFYNFNNYRHYAVKISPEKYLIISRKLTPTTLKIVVFSIIFILLSIISIFIYLMLYARKVFYSFRLSLKARLQSLIISTLTITFILMGITTLIFFNDIIKENIKKQLTEKANSVLIELQHKLSPINSFKNQDKELLQELLHKFSMVFFTDINLYDDSGKLLATSRPEIFNKNLLSKYVNPSAFNAIFHENKLEFITEEKIGTLKYFSAFVPINLNNDSPIGIVNLPYFARQNQITKSYYIMLSYLLNIYVIIGIIGALIAIIFSRYLTKPLVLLQESIAAIRIDKHNEKIQWNKNDEIGLLINEYNLMVGKLEQSAELLKHSERENAWREVARQIAHEIKNPLTPMKLNVQYLEKAYKNNDPEFAIKIKSISKSLITQIDVLNDVAEMFSDFSKSKSKHVDRVNLKDVITSAVNLFNKNDKVSISTNYKNVKGKLITLGHEKDLLRVITNILKNAIQSITNDKKGLITINVTTTSQFIIVVITDNGKGISEEMKSKIFHPYFTTKTSGTGLGLAITKNIMNEIGGSVNFESVSTGGTQFVLKFPSA